MDGIDLAREVKMRWPLLSVILTSGHPRERVGELPPAVAYSAMHHFQPGSVTRAAISQVLDSEPLLQDELPRVRAARNKSP
jgi:hypothetical protein